MSDEVLPLIAKVDYPAFQAIIGELPRTYDEWRRLHYVERARRRTADGVYPTDIPISGAGFMTFRQARPTWSASIDMLWHCAREKAAQAASTQGGYEAPDDC